MPKQHGTEFVALCEDAKARIAEISAAETKAMLSTRASFFLLTFGNRANGIVATHKEPFTWAKGSSSATLKTRSQTPQPRSFCTAEGVSAPLWLRTHFKKWGTKSVFTGGRLACLVGGERSR